MDVLHETWQWDQLLEPLLKLIGALLLTLPVAWERERSTRVLGLRTFSLVSLASCGYVLMATRVVGLEPEPQARIIEGLMTGIGFIGGGAILKQGVNVRGTATAASIWLTGALGASVGYGELEIAVLLSGLNYLALRILTPLGERLDRAEKEEAEASPPEGGRKS